MALFNYATKEITLKIVYYGPGLSGKTTNLQHLHAVLNPETKGKLLSLSTEADRTLFFDFLPVELGKIRDFSIRFQLYTVPGQVRYNATRKVVLKGADAVVFVADSQADMRDQNIESYENMRENLTSNNINPDTVPIVMQYNKRDLGNILSVDAMNADLNRDSVYAVLEAAAIDGTGVEETFKKITRLLLKDISRKHKIEIQPTETGKPAPHTLPIAPVEELQPDDRPAAARESVAAEAGMAHAETSAVTLSREALPGDEDETLTILEDDALASESGDGDVIEDAIPLVDAAPLSAAAVEAAFEEISALDVTVDEPAIPIVDHPRGEEPPIRASISPPSAARPVSEEAVAGPDPYRREIERMRESIDKVSGSIDRLSRAILDLKADVLMMREELLRRPVSAEKASQEEPAKELIELQREQQEMLDLVRDMADVLNSAREKRSWLKF